MSSSKDSVIAQVCRMREYRDSPQCKKYKIADAQQCIPDKDWEKKCPGDWGCCRWSTGKDKALKEACTMKPDLLRSDECKKWVKSHRLGNGCMYVDDWEKLCPNDWGCCKRQGFGQKGPTKMDGTDLKKYCQSQAGKGDPKCKDWLAKNVHDGECVFQKDWEKKCPNDWGCCKEQKRRGTKPVPKDVPCKDDYEQEKCKEWKKSHVLDNGCIVDDDWKTKCPNDYGCCRKQKREKEGQSTSTESSSAKKIAQDKICPTRPYDKICKDWTPPSAPPPKPITIDDPDIAIKCQMKPNEPVCQQWRDRENKKRREGQLKERCGLTPHLEECKKYRQDNPPSTQPSTDSGGDDGDEDPGHCVPVDGWEEKCPGDWGCCQKQKRDREGDSDSSDPGSTGGQSGSSGETQEEEDTTTPAEKKEEPFWKKHMTFIIVATIAFLLLIGLVFVVMLA